jgi:hypothetical protein
MPGQCGSSRPLRCTCELVIPAVLVALAVLVFLVLHLLLKKRTFVSNPFTPRIGLQGFFCDLILIRILQVISADDSGQGV